MGDFFGHAVPNLLKVSSETVLPVFGQGETTNGSCRGAEALTGVDVCEVGASAIRFLAKPLSCQHK